MNKKWVKVEGYDEGYYINKKGEVASLWHDGSFKILRLYHPKNGYVSGCLMRGGKQLFFLLHRLLAIAFIENPNNKKCVNHKNGNKNDNRLSNLEWVSHQENTSHGYKTGLISPSYGMLGKVGKKHHSSKGVDQISVGTGEVIKSWDSLHCPTREKGWDFRNIHACITGARPTAYGFKWRYTV